MPRAASPSALVPQPGVYRAFESVGRRYSDPLKVVLVGTTRVSATVIVPAVA